MSERVVGVACSGGRDSLALLHATVHAAASSGGSVVALHVHHGLSPNADDWWKHVDLQCGRWARRGLPVRFVGERLNGRPVAGESVEAWARSARYAALARMAEAQNSSIVLLAHHRRDQAETFLLQALRGAGVAGLSSMPLSIDRQGLTWARPWLAQPRAAIEAYCRRYRIAYIDDDSNADDRYARNRLRHVVWPALIEAFPDAESTLVKAAQWSQEAVACLAELAADDLARVSPVRDLGVTAWLGLSAPRRSNVLRAWLRRTMDSAPASLVERLLIELPQARTGAMWALANGVLRRDRDALRWYAASAHAAAASTLPSSSPAVLPETRTCIRRAGCIALPGWGGVLRATRVRDGGVPIAYLATLELRARSGGEQFQAGVGRPPRSLKKQFQSAGVHSWQRNGPLVFSGGLLVYVPGLGIDSRMLALPGQPQVTLSWEPSASA